MTDPNLNLTNLKTSIEVNNSNEINISFSDFIIEQVSSALNLYYTPLLVLLGTIGNLVSVFVFFNSKLRLQSTSQYLSALAISDTLFLFQLLPPWLNAIQVTEIFHRPGFCTFFVYISYVSSCLSAWLVVAFTVERFVAVLYPLQRNAVCTIKRARLIICGITLTCMLLNMPLLRLAVAKKNDCNIDSAYMDYAATFNMMDTIISFTTPMIIISLLNIWIMFGVCGLERARQRMIRTEQLQLRPVTARVQTCPRSQNKVTRMLLIVSSVFVILNLPAYTMRIIAYAYNVTKGTEEDGPTLWTALQEVALLFFNTNFGINFYLYCLSGQNFRRALKQILFRQTARRRDAIRRHRSRPLRVNSITTSFVTNYTETTACRPITAMNPTDRDRRNRGHFISRWTFDNSRQQRQPTDQIAMRDISPSYEYDSD